MRRIRRNRSRLCSISFSAAAAFLFFFSISASAKETFYDVKDVVDGDTIELASGKRVRYIGIDTPETRRKSAGSWIFDPEDMAVSAKEFNRSLVYGKKVRLEFDADRKDRYGRSLAYVYTASGEMVNAAIVSEGYSMTFTFPPNVKHREELLSAQKEAMARKSGLWKDMLVISPRDAEDFAGTFCIARGEVSQVSLSPREIFIHFSPGSRKTLTLTIYADNLMYFTREGVDPVNGLKGKTIEAYGKIEYKDGPEMYIDSPLQLRVISDK